MLRAVTNRDFPLLRRSLKSLFDMELDFDPSLNVEGRSAIIGFIRKRFSNDPMGRVRIIFVDTADLSYGRAGDVEVTGFNIPHKKLTFIGVPESVDDLGECYGESSMDAYLLVVTLHELYELFTGDFGHCDNPRRCINSSCSVYGRGTCSSCMGALVDRIHETMTLEDLYCEEHLTKLREALRRWEGQ